MSFFKKMFGSKDKDKRKKGGGSAGNGAGSGRADSGMAVSARPGIDIPFNITVVGDAGCGKTTMLRAIALMCPSLTSESSSQKESHEELPDATTESDGTEDDGLFDSHEISIAIGDQSYKVCLWDTEASEQYSRFRALSYEMTDLFLVCFSCSDSESFNNVQAVWAGELRQLCPNVPVVLVGTKPDLRDSSATGITTSQGMTLYDQLNAVLYMECCAIDNESVEKLFKSAVRWLAANFVKQT